MEKANKDNSALRFLIVLILATLALALASGFKAYEETPDALIENNAKPVTVFAAAGTTVAIQRIAEAFENQTGRKVVTNFASSSTLAKQIAAGADFDVYISANSKWMDFVSEKNLISPETRTNLLNERLVLIAPKDAATQVEESLSIKDLLEQTEGQVSIGDPTHVPVGMYTKEALEAMGCWDAVSERMIPAVSVRAAQLNVETGQCPLGIVYRAGAFQSTKVKILATFDESLHSPIEFSVASAANSQHGKAFLEFLKTPASDTIFTIAGFATCLPQAAVTVSPADASPASAYRINEWRAFVISLKVAAACTLVVAAPGIGLGYLLARKSFPGRALVNSIVCVPMVIPPVVTGYLALVMLGRNSALGSWLHDTWGISVAFSWIGAVLVSAVMGFPLLVRSVKTAVEMIDQRYTHAANTLGAGSVRTFFTITLPLAGPGILAGLILAFARSLGEFGATATFAGNIPGKTQTLSLAIYNFTQIPGAEGAAMRLVGISILLSFGAMLGSELLSHRMKSLLGATA